VFPKTLRAKSSGPEPFFDTPKKDNKHIPDAFHVRAPPPTPGLK